MRKTVVLLGVLGLLGANSAHAQWSVTPEAGMTAVMSPNTMKGNSWIPSWRLGAGVDYQFPNSRWAISSGIFLTERVKQENVSGDFIANPDGSYYLSNRPIRSYKDAATSFYVPIMAKYTFPLANEVNLSLATGFYAGYCFARSTRNFHNYLPEEEDVYYIFPEPTYFDWGVLFRTELNVKNWVVSAGYEASLGVESRAQYSNIARRNVFHTVTLSVGYKFQL